MCKFRLFVPLALALGLSSNAAAAPVVLYDNLQAPSGGQESVGAGSLFASFSTGSLPSTLYAVRLEFSAWEPGSGSGVEIGLYSDDGTIFPGSLLASLGTMPDSALNIEPSVYDASVVPVNLTPNSRYWIGLSPLNNTSAQWSWAYAAANDQGVATEYWSDGITLYQNPDFGAFQMEVSASQAPEPASWTLSALGIVAWAGFRRRRTAPDRGRS